MYESVAFQSYDQMIIYKVPENNKKDNLFILFIDEKAGRIQSTNDSDANSTVFNDFHQYDSIVRVIDQLKEMQQNGMILTPLSEALVKGNYRYIYFTTKGYLSDEAQDFINANPNIIVALKKKNRKVF